MDSLLQRDAIGLGLARHLHGTAVEHHKLEALDNYFAWSEQATLQRWSDMDFATRFHRWFRTIEIESGLRSRIGWYAGRDELRKIRFWLREPHTPLRAAAIGFMPMLNLHSAVSAIQTEWKHDSNLLFTPKMWEFYADVSGMRFNPKIWFAALFGHISFMVLISMGFMELVWPHSKRGEPVTSHYWMTVGLIAQAVFVHCWHLLHSYSSRIAVFFVQQRWLFMFGYFAVPLFTMIFIGSRE